MRGTGRDRDFNGTHSYLSRPPLVSPLSSSQTNCPPVGDDIVCVHGISSCITSDEMCYIAKYSGSEQTCPAQ
jgi:hypothetical protein